MGLLRWAVRIVLLLVALAVVGGALAWMADYGVEATVTRTDCVPSFGGDAASTVSVQANLVPLGADVKLPYQQCVALQNGNFVIYHVRSGRTSLYQRQGGPCIYDSAGGVGGCPS